MSGGRIRSTSTATAADAGSSSSWCARRGLGHGRKGFPFDPHELLPGRIEDSHARQCQRLGEHADDKKVVFDVVHTVVGADNLGLVNRTDKDCGRPV